VGQLTVGEAGRRAVEHDFATGQADHAIGKAPRQLDVVHVDQDRDLVMRGGIAQQGDDLDGRLGVERGGRLLRQQQPGRLHQRASDADTPALAA
jgi:hypothetical protein